MSLNDKPASRPRFLPLEPTHHSDRLPPTEPVEQSFLTNRIRIALGGKLFWIEPADTTDSGSLPAELEALLPLHYLTAWNPGGDRASFEQNEQLHLRLAERLSSALDKQVAEVGADGVGLLPAVAVANDASWYEHGWAVRGLPIELAHRIAVDHDQAGLITVSREGLTFTPRVGIRATEHTGWRLVQREQEHCPLRPFNAPDSLCGVSGGPFTSRSRSVLAIWQEHRRIGLTLLGCGTCANGTEPIHAWGGKRVLDPAAGVIRLREVMVASRFGGYCWGAYAELDFRND